MSRQRSAAYRQLMAASAFFLLTHAVGLIGMGAWLLPGFDPPEARCHGPRICECRRW